MARLFDADERYDGSDYIATGDEEIGLDSVFVPLQIAQAAADSDFTNTVSPDALTATENDYPLGEGTYFRLSTSGGAQIITGFGGGKAGRLVFICNVAGGANITLNNQDVASAAQNRIITGTGAAVNIQPDRAAVLFYDGVTLRWRVVGLT